MATVALIAATASISDRSERRENECGASMQLPLTAHPTQLARCKRRALNLSPTAVAKASGADRSLLSRIERGHERATDKFRRALADVSRRGPRPS
jgi:hypothetical protein